MFNLFFDKHIIDVIVNKKNTTIANTLSRLRAKTLFIESDQYNWVREIGRIEGNALFGLMYFRGLLDLHLHIIDHLFADYKGHFVFGAIMSKIGSSFCLATIPSVTLLIDKRIDPQIALEQ